MAIPTPAQSFFSGTDTAVGWATGPAVTLKITLPNKSLANNLLVFAFAYNNGITLSTVTDNNSNTWTNLAAASGTDGTNTFQVYYVPGAPAGTQTVTATFTGNNGTNAPNVWGHVSEWYNVATSTPTDGANLNAGAATSPYSPGSITPTTDGDLILCWGWANPNSGTGSSTALTASKSIANTQFNLLHGDLLPGGFTNTGWAEYGIQSTAAAINPQVVTTGNTNQTMYVAIAAFKSAAAGTAPSTNGTQPRVWWGQTCYLGQTPTKNMPLAIPSNCNTIIASFQSNTSTPAISDSLNGPWSVPASAMGSNASSADNAGIAYVLNAKCAPSAVMTWNVGSATGDPIVTIYGVTGLGAFDNGANTNGNQTSSSGTVSTVQITPTTKNGLVFASCALSWNDVIGVSVSGETAVCMSVVNGNLADGQSGNSPLTEDNGHAIVNNQTTNQETFVWTCTTAATQAGGGVGEWAAGAAAFIGAQGNEWLLTC